MPTRTDWAPLRHGIGCRVPLRVIAQSHTRREVLRKQQALIKGAIQPCTLDPPCTTVDPTFCILHAKGRRTTSSGMYAVCGARPCALRDLCGRDNR